MYKYVCSTKSYSNCRAHDGGFPSGLVFFESLQSAQDAILKDIDWLEYGSLYSVETGTVYARLEYELSHHSVSQISIQVGARKATTVDNGHGKKEWSTKVECCEKCNGTRKIKPPWRSTIDAVLPVKRCGECGQSLDPLELHEKEHCPGNPKCYVCDGMGFV